MIWLPILLADPSACLRFLVLRDLFQRESQDEELLECAASRLSDPLVQRILAVQDEDGSWPPGALAIGRAGGTRVLMTGMALSRLGYLGFHEELPAVRKGAEYLFACQNEDGSWNLPDQYEEEQHEEAPQSTRERYSMIPLQTAFPLRGLAACGYAADPRAEKAYEWLLAQRLVDGAWPTGIASGVYGYVAGYRRLAHSRWGCRSNTTGALMCLSLHPVRRRGPEAQRALDLLLGRETRDRQAVGFEVARMVGAEPARGFMSHFARYDLAMLLDLCSRVGASAQDPRVDDLLQFIDSLQGAYGLWEYSAHPQVSRWLTLDLLRSKTRLGRNQDWIGMEPRTPFQPYPKPHRRF